MKGKNENSIIVLYSIQEFERRFNNYELSDGRKVVLFYLSDKEVLENEGFFDVVLPEIQEGEKLGDIYFDEENRIFTYPVLNKTQEEIDAQNRAFVPQTVSQRQIRTQLVLSGFNLTDIDAAIDSLSEPDRSIALIAWDYAVTFERESPLLVSLALILGLTDTDLDNIFINASQL